MKARKRILLLTSPDGAFTTLSPQLEPLNFEVVAVHSVEATLSYIRQQASIAIVVIDGLVDGVTGELVGEIRGVTGELPIAWLMAAGQDEPDFGLAEPNAIYNSLPSAEDFAKRADKLLSADYYPKSIVITVVSAANSVLATTFQASVDVGSPWLKLSSLLPGEFNAFVPFMGKDSAGHVIVSGQRAQVVALGMELGFEDASDARAMAREVLGEIANQIVGRVKIDCGGYLPDVRVGLPLVISGKELGISYPSARPCVSVEVGDERGHLHVEFSFHRANVGADDSNLQDAGEVVLF